MSQLTVVGVKDISVWQDADLYFIEKIINFVPSLTPFHEGILEI